jgi:curved DNA-binding protein CbpA
MSEIKKINEAYNILLDLKRNFKKDLATEAIDPGNNVDFKDGAVKNSYPSKDNINQQLLQRGQDFANARTAAINRYKVPAAPAAPAAPAVTDQAPKEPGSFGEVRDGYQWNDIQGKWIKLQ